MIAQGIIVFTASSAWWWKASDDMRYNVPPVWHGPYQSARDAYLAAPKEEAQL